MLNDYLHDMRIIQRYVELNRKAIVKELEKRVKFKITDQFTTIHNYIDLDSMILRKGAISAQKDEQELFKLSQHHRFGASSEKSPPNANQLSLFDSPQTPSLTTKAETEPKTETINYIRRKRTGKRQEDLSKLPLEVVKYKLPESERGSRIAAVRCGSSAHKSATR